MSPLKIALILPAFEPAVDYGGPVAKVRLLAESLVAVGQQVEVWCADFDLGRRRLTARSSRPSGIPVRYFRRLVSYHWSPVVPQALYAARRADFDIAHVIGLRDGLSPFAAAGFASKGTPIVLEPVGMLVPAVRNLALKRAFDRLVPNPALRRAAGLIATSSLEAEALAPLGRQVWLRYNPVVPPQPADPHALRRRLAVPDTHIIVGSLGRISRSKGLDLLVDAVAALPHVQLLLAGPDDDDGALADLHTAIKRSDASDRIHLLGPTHGAAKAELLAGLDAFVLPSVTESFGNAAVEAALTGCPVILNEHCGAAPLLESCGGAAVVPRTVDAYRAAISQVGRRPVRAPWVAALREQVDPAAIAQAQLGIYEEAMAIHRSKPL